MKRAIVIAVIAIAIAAGAYIALRGPGVAVAMTQPTRMTVREYVAEDAETRLDDEYIVDMPVSGTLERVELDIGDHVEAGQVIARIDPYTLEQRIRQTKAQIDQRRAQIIGVDIAKPKPEDIESARVRVQEMKDALQIARKSLTAAEVNLEDARKDYERAKGLLEAGAESQAYYDRAETRYRTLQEEMRQRSLEVDRAQQGVEQAQLAYQRVLNSIDDNEYERTRLMAEIDALEAELAVLKDDLGKTEIKAPVSGPILEKFIEDRRVLIEGSEILKIGDMDSIEIECDVLSEEITRVQVGNKVVIRGQAILPRLVEGETLEGVVKRIYPAGFEKISSLGVEQQRVRTRIGFDNSEVQLRPGTSVDVEIITAEAPDALAVPDRAVFRHEGGYAVFIVEDGHARLRPVEVGLRNEDWAEIRSGLSEEDIVVAELNNELQDGARVTSLESASG